MLNFNRSKQIFLLMILAMVGSSQAFSVVNIIFHDWVMWPIMALSVIAFAVILERLMVVFLEKRKIKPSKFMDEFLAKVGEDGKGKDEAVAWGIELCSKKGGILAALLLAAFHKYKDGKSKNMHAGELKEWMTKSVEQRAGVELMVLENHLSALAVIANVSTLMGLFGTVVGMISSFTAMANSPGGVKADEMAGGIAIALVATAGGLVVAIPSLIVYNVLKGAVIENYVAQVEECCINVVDALAE